MSRKSIVTVFAAALVTAAVLTASPVLVALQKDVQKPTALTLAERIEYRLNTDTTVRKYDIKVKVDDQGTAMLSGKVATLAQKADAALLSKIDGVKRVENDIVVDPNVDKTLGDYIKDGFSKTGEKISDAWVTTKIKWFFLGDDGLKGSDIDVDTSNHVVTLKGTVRSTVSRDRAIALAKDTEGVHRVNSELKIVPAK